jgi:hypothetical protein
MTRGYDKNFGRQPAARGRRCLPSAPERAQ